MQPIWGGHKPEQGRTFFLESDLASPRVATPTNFGLLHGLACPIELNTSSTYAPPTQEKAHISSGEHVIKALSCLIVLTGSCRAGGSIRLYECQVIQVSSCWPTWKTRKLRVGPFSCSSARRGEASEAKSPSPWLAQLAGGACMKIFLDPDPHRLRNAGLLGSDVKILDHHLTYL